MGHVLATAHDVAREHRVLCALAQTTVPVPEVHLLCTDPEVIGAPFLLMERVDGIVVREREQVIALGPQRARALGAAMIDCLVDLHRVAPSRVGLGDFGRPEGFLARQVRRWKRQLDASHSRELPGADQLIRLLTERLPSESGAAAIVHGDYRLDNLLVVPRGQIAAVLDWEMASLGDPLTDLALLTVYRELADLGAGDLGVAGCAAPGMPTSEEMIHRYATGQGHDLPNLGYHRALAYFKLAAILEGIHYRFQLGETIGPGFDQIGAIVPTLIEAGLETFKEIR